MYLIIRPVKTNVFKLYSPKWRPSKLENSSQALLKKKKKKIQYLYKPFLLGYILDQSNTDLFKNAHDRFDVNNKQTVNGLDNNNKHLYSSF